MSNAKASIDLLPYFEYTSFSIGVRFMFRAQHKNKTNISSPAGRC